MTALFAQPASVEAFLSTPRRLLIDGLWEEAASGQRFDVTDPGTGNVIANAAEGEAADIDRAVSSARAAFDDERWRGLAAPIRAQTLWRVAELLEAHADELALLESLDQGTQLRNARGMILVAAQSFRYYAGWVDKVHGQTSEINGPGGNYHAYTLLEPVGVTGLIVPWNVPLVVAALKVAPALAAGCSCVLKPAEETPLTALRLGQILLDAGVPAGVVNVITGFGATAGAALAAHPDVDKVSFTGSTEVGRLIVAAAANSNLKKLTLELGGKSPVVILDDADLDQAIPAAAAAILNNTGQVCSAGSRLFVSDGRFDQVVEGVAAIGKRTRVGYGPDNQSDIGPLISAKQLDRVSGYIASGVADGAEILTGGKRIGDTGYYVEPTVMVNVRPDMAIVREEIFGPVLVASPFADLDDIAQLANDTTYGLAASVWTRDISKAHKLARKIRSGKVGINVHSVGDSSMPSGGYKTSGWGRENGLEGIKEYMETKSVYTRL